VATFSNVILDTAGSYTLTASDGSLTSANSTSFTVTAAAASKVVYATQPSNVVAGVANSPSIVVNVEDQFGNIVTTDSSNVSCPFTADLDL
jgi:trimeric autotransporter adhesin